MPISNENNSVLPNPETPRKVPHALNLCLDPNISSATTLLELLEIIRSYPEATSAAEKEMERKRKDEEKARIRDWINQEVESTSWEQLIASGQKSEKEAESESKRRPGAIQLRVSCPCIAQIQIDQSCRCEVFSNGYAIYDNGDRKTVLWVPNCGDVTYYFCQLTESERNYQKQYEHIDQETMLNNAWFIPIVIAGEDQIERNMEHPKSESGNSDYMQELERMVKPAIKWCGSSHFDDPETAYLQKEAWEEWFGSMSESQRMVYNMYYVEGMTQQEIADKLNISQAAVICRLNKLGRKARKVF